MTSDSELWLFRLQAQYLSTFGYHRPMYINKFYAPFFFLTMTLDLLYIINKYSPQHTQG